MKKKHSCRNLNNIFSLCLCRNNNENELTDLFLFSRVVGIVIAVGCNLLCDLTAVMNILNAKEWSHDKMKTNNNKKTTYYCKIVHYEMIRWTDAMIYDAIHRNKLADKVELFIWRHHQHLDWKEIVVAGAFVRHLPKKVKREWLMTARWTYDIGHYARFVDEMWWDFYIGAFLCFNEFIIIAWRV